MSEKEEWRPVEGYEGHYQISNLGNVKSFRGSKPKILTPCYDKDGYRVVTLCVNQHHDVRHIHKLVAEAFVPRVEGKDIVNHIDGVKTNNISDNLEWCTTLENTQHAVRIGLWDSHYRAVRCVETGEVFQSVTAAAKHLNCLAGRFSRNIKAGHRIHGFHFEYINKHKDLC